MLSFINNLLNTKKIFDLSPEVADPFITQVLSEIKECRTPLTIKFNDSSLLYASMILDVNVDDRKIKIDEIFPNDGNIKALKASEIMISTRHKGILVTFDVKIANTGKEGSYIYYDLEFPEEIDHQQRRAAFRVVVPMSSPIKTNFIIDGYPNFRGVVSDISLSGLRMQLPNNVASIFRNMKYINNVKLDLGENVVDCRLKICYCEYKPTTRLTSIGCEFYDLTFGQQRVITKTVTGLERESCNKESFD